MPAALILTRHAKRRAKERMGLNPKALQRTAAKAFANGLRQDQTKGRLRRWLSDLQVHTGTADNIRVYGRHVFVICGQTLVTILYLPKPLNKLAAECAAERNQP